MFEEFVGFAKTVLSVRDDEEIRRVAEEIERISKDANEMLERIEEDFEELLNVEPKLKGNVVRLLELALSDGAFDLAKCLAVLNGEVLKDVAEEVYSKRFENYGDLIEELKTFGVLEESDITFRLADAVRKSLDELAEAEHHELAVEYYERLPDSLENRAYLAYHCLKADKIDRALELFVETANKLYGRHPCVDILIDVGERLANRVDEENRCRVLGTLGNLNLLIKKYDEAEAYYRTVLNYYRKRTEEKPEYLSFVVGVLNNLGNLYFAKGELERAESTYTECLKIAMDLEDEDRMVSVLLALGDLYMAKDDYENAEKCFHDALRIELKMSREDVGRKKNVAMIVNNLGYLYSRRGEYEKAERFYKEAVRLFGELSKDDREMLGNLAAALSNLSSLYMNTGNVEGAMEVLEAIRERWNEIPPDVRATFYVNLAKGLEKRGDPKAGEFYLKAGALGFMIFRNYGINAVNFMHCFDKAEQIGESKVRGDAKLMKSVIMKVYYGVKSELPEVENCSRRGELIIRALKGEKIDGIEIGDEVDMAAYVLANELGKA